MSVNPKKIMCAVDFSDFTDALLAYSLALCKLFHAKLFLVHIVMDVNMSFVNSGISFDKAMLQDSHTKHARESLGELAKAVTIEHEILVGKGDPADEICRLALKEKIDMVITATHGKSGITRLLIGSVTEKLMKTLHCPFLVMHTQWNGFTPQNDAKMTLKKVLVGCDFSEDSKLAFDYGVSFAQEYQADLYLAHVVKSTEFLEMKTADEINVIPGDYRAWSAPDYLEMQKKETQASREKIDKLCRRFERQLYFMVPEVHRSWCNPHTAVLTGEPYKKLITYAKEQEIDMIVLGIRGHTLWEKLMVGSTTDRVIRYAPCPVLAVRQMG